MQLTFLTQSRSEVVEMLRKFKITYKWMLGHRTMTVEAYSKYNAKKRFYVQHPKCEIVKIEEVNDGKATD